MEDIHTEGKYSQNYRSEKDLHGYAPRNENTTM